MLEVLQAVLATTGGGGGGSGAVGARMVVLPLVGGGGGIGTANSITGTAVYYAVEARQAVYNLS